MSAPKNPGTAKLPANAAAHDPFSFVANRLKHDPNARFAASVLDITQGIGLCLELVNSSTTARMMNEHCDPHEEQIPMLDPFDTDRLMRFATASATLMASHAEKHIEWMNKYYDREGK